MRGERRESSSSSSREMACGTVERLGKKWGWNGTDGRGYTLRTAFRLRTPLERV